MKTLVIIPAYNEERNITNLALKVSELSYDYLVINDCSTDKTGELLDENGLNHLDLPTNAGIATVTQVGFKYARDNGYEQAIVIDGDGQHPPKYIHSLLQALEEGYDYALGSRYVTKKKPWNMRMIGSRLIGALIFLKTGKTIHDPTSGMRALGGKVLNDFADNMNFIAEPDALTHVLRKKNKVIEIQVDMSERESGQSYFASPFKSMAYMIKIILSIVFVQ